MSRIIWFNRVTLDGYFAGVYGEIDWQRADAEISQWIPVQLAAAARLIFGRRNGWRIPARLRAI